MYWILYWVNVFFILFTIYDFIQGYLYLKYSDDNNNFEYNIQYDDQNTINIIEYYKKIFSNCIYVSLGVILIYIILYFIISHYIDKFNKR